MGKFHDRTGTVSGKLTLLKSIGPHRTKGWLYECRCECGNITIRGTGSLRGNNNQCWDCGVKARAAHAILPKGIGVIGKIFGYYRYNAKTRGHSFDLTRDEFIKLIESPCYYCGIDHSLSMREYVDTYYYNGVDRLDSSLGYTVTNCVACCSICNHAKSTLSLQEFTAWARRLSNHLFKD